MKTPLIAVAVLTVLATSAAGQDFDPTAEVDPFIGTGAHGHTFPGATVPFGMVQLSPDTRLEGWDGCSGYHYSDDHLFGFSHTHLQGTGVSDYGDILLVPTVGEVRWNNGADGRPGYWSRFRKETETASPGYYAVTLDDPGVRAELTTTTRTGVHRYTFPATDAANVLLDLVHRDTVTDSSIEIVGDREVRGFRRSRAWAEDQHCYFVARFSQPFTKAVISRDGQPVGGTSATGTGLRAAFRFATTADESIVVKVGISGVDIDGAIANLEAEVLGFDFDRVRAEASETWRKTLSRLRVHGGSSAQRRTFYTALYHCYVAPNTWSDVDGRYRGRDGAVHETDGWTAYTVFSLWDTFRALHPLLTWLEQERTNDFVKTMLAQHEQGGALPVWELAGNETNCMIGYHSVPVIWDAYRQGLRGFDAAAALDAMVATADRDHRGLPGYKRLGFVPAEEESESVSKTLEYAYDDWCISEMARALGRDEIAARFHERAQSWRNLFDPETGFFRARRHNGWTRQFDPAEVNFHFTEANAWQYSLFVPHDIDGLAAALGGPDALGARLDALFGAPAQTTGREQADITGRIGQYAHGNEPSHHMAYLYAFAGKPARTQWYVREILDTLYSDQPDGLCGNEDCGQMSAWYVWSVLGMYPVTPGSGEYIVGAPLFPSVEIRRADGKMLTISRRGEGQYVQKADLGHDGPLAGPVVRHDQLLGTIAFDMGPVPSDWGSAPETWPRAGLAGPQIVPVPFVASGERAFAESTEVSFGVAADDARILVSRDGGATFTEQLGPITVTETTELHAVAERWRTVMLPGGAVGERVERRSRIVRARFVRVPNDWTLRFEHPWAPQYAGDGIRTLLDGLRGANDFRTGDWQGWQGVDMDAVLDLGGKRKIRAVRAGFLQEQRSWIWMPQHVDVAVSSDGVTFEPIGRMTHDVNERAGESVVRTLELRRKVRARYVRITAVNRKTCPHWHPGAGHPAWVFADEIEIDTVE